MAGTLVHEISHFHIVADNADNAYGQPPCQQLAITYPLNAVNNADSYQYFSENNPMLT
jgi:peptidyl-Lys metalloendopeptidase